VSDDLYARMNAAASEAIKAATPAESGDETVAVEAAAEEQPEATEPDAAEAGEAEEVSEESEAEEAQAAEAEEEEPAAERDIADEILAVRQAAERRVRQAESRMRELEAKLAKSDERVQQTQKQVVDEIFKRLRRAPARTFKEFGFEFQDLIDAGMREGQMHEGAFGEIDEVRQELKALREERESMRRETEERQMQSQLAEARTSFLRQVSKDQFPTLFNMFEDDVESLWQEAMSVAESHESQHGEQPEDIDVLRYLEDKYKRKLSRLGAAPAAAPAPVSAQKKGVKTISTKAASETRTAGKPFGQLDADQQKAALLAAVKKATSQPAN
jgi:hypothetical protein